MSQINPDTMRHLSYAKSLYFHALQHSNSESVLDRAISVVNFDGAIETFLYALMDYIGAEVSEKANYNELLNAVKLKFREMNLDLALLQEVSVKNLHRARNGTQHHGIIPCIDNIERYKTITYQVLSNLSEYVLKKKFEEICLSELIQANEVKTLYKRAEEAYFSANYEAALVNVAGAFERAKNLEQGKLWGSGMLSAIILHKEDENYRLLTLISKELEILKLRLDYKKYQKYRQTFSFALEPFTNISSKTTDNIIGEIRTLAANAISTWHNTNPEELKNTTTFCLGFVIDSILQWETVPREGWRS